RGIVHRLGVQGNRGRLPGYLAMTSGRGRLLSRLRQRERLGDRGKRERQGSENQDDSGSSGHGQTTSESPSYKRNASAPESASLGRPDLRPNRLRDDHEALRGRPDVREGIAGDEG